MHPMSQVPPVMPLPISRVFSNDPMIVLAGFDLDASHVLEEEEIDHDFVPTVTARDVVDRETLKAFVTEAGQFYIASTGERGPRRFPESQERHA